MRSTPDDGAGGRRRRWAVAVAVLISVALALPAAPSFGAPPAGTPAAGKGLWSAKSGGLPAVSAAGRKAAVRPEKYRAYGLDHAGMRSALGKARPVRPGRQVTPDAAVAIELPTPTGGFASFAVAQSSILAPALAARHPEITTYVGRGLDDPRATVRLDLTPLGFHASVRGAPGQGTWYVDPAYQRDTSAYVSYLGKDLEDVHGTFVEGADGGAVEQLLGDLAVPTGPAVTLRTYRLALLTDPSYAAYFGSENVLAAKVTLMNRVNQVYEDDLAISLQLVEQTEALNLDTAAKATGADGPCGSAPCFTAAQLAGCGGGTLTRNRIVLGQLVGASGYDIGHIGLGVNGGGVASAGVGSDGKARGCTGLAQPVGDVYAVDYVAHEMGHQFSGSHTFNGTQRNCAGGNRSAATSVEPGSGSSVMAYAGICDADDLQPHSDPYFSQRSRTQVQAYVTASPPPITEVQTVSLRGFDVDGERITLSYGGASRTITRGTNASAAGIAAAVGELTGSTVTVAGYAAAATVDGAGFQVTFSGPGLAQTDLPSLQVTSDSAGVSGFVGETAKGGPVQNGGVTAVDSGNHAPVVTGAGDHVIPLRTPFALTGSATDSDGDALTYLWEQDDRGGATGTALLNGTKTNGPLFRQFGVAHTVTPAGTLLSPSPGLNLADGNPTRVFPDLAQVLAGTTNAATGTCPATPTALAVECFSEFLPTSDYVGVAGVNAAPARLRMRLTVRDAHPGAGGAGTADTVLTLSTAGPFRVTSQASAGTSLAGGRAHTVTWDVNGTDAAALAPTVRIRLSSDGGLTWPTVLAPSTPNDGTQSVVLPNPSSPLTRSRLKVEAVGNVFFDVNRADFTIAPALVVGNDAPAAGAGAQYSDPLVPTVTVSAADGAAAGSSLTATAAGLPAGYALTVATTSDPATRPGTRTWAVTGNGTAPPGDYPVTVTVQGADGRTEQTTFTVVVTREDARVTYTGLQSVATSSPTARTAALTLAATVRDVTAVPGDPATDAFAGDVRRATVSFVDRETGAVLCSAAGVGLVNPGDTRTGSATCEHTVDLGSADARTLNVGVVVGGSYARDAGADDTLVSVFKPLASSFVAGGGTLVLSTPAGAKAGDVGSKTNVAVSVKYNKGGTNLQGSVNVLTRRTESDGVVHTYQVKGTALTSLTVAGRSASFVSRATVTDITDPAAPVAVEGGATLQLGVTDNGDPGTLDTLAITVLSRSGGTWFASAWNGTRTVEQALAGGNLRVR